MSARPARRVPFSLGAAAVIMACYGVAAAVAALLPGLHGAATTAVAGVLSACMAGIVAWVAAPRLAAPRPPELAPPPIGLQPETARLEARLTFERQFGRALDRTRRPADVYEVTTRAFDAIGPGQPTELLMTGGTRGRLKRMAVTGPDGVGPGCPVGEAGHCDAVRLDRTLRWASSNDLDACPHLAGRPTACSAVCIPVRVLGEPVGVVHRTGPDGVAPAEFDVHLLESVGARLEARLGVLQLTPGDDAGPDGRGVLRRTELARRVDGLRRQSTGFALARCAVDDLAGYAARHGREPAEAAVRTLEAVALRSIRPADLVGRGGPGELLVVFANASVDAVHRVLDRIREEFALQLNEQELPPVGFDSAAVRAGGTQGLDDLLEVLDPSPPTPSTPSTAG